MLKKMRFDGNKLTNFSNKSRFMLDGLFQRAGHDAHGNSEVRAGLCDPQAADHIEIHILVP